MATHHASAGEIVDLQTWANDLPEQVSKVITVTDDIELARLVFKSGDSFPENILPGPVILHCLTGKIQLNVSGTVKQLLPGQLSFLFAVEPHSIKVLADSVILITIVFSHNNH